MRKKKGGKKREEKKEEKEKEKKWKRKTYRRRAATLPVNSGILTFLPCDGFLLGIVVVEMGVSFLPSSLFLFRDCSVLAFFFGGGGGERVRRGEREGKKGERRKKRRGREPDFTLGLV